MDSNLCKISVVMSVFNENEVWLRESINSILNQTYKEFEYIIVVDSPSIDKRNQVETIINNDKRVKLIFNEENIGLVKSLNKGMSVAKGNYICRMDADDISHVDRLEKQLKIIEEENVDFLFSDVNTIDELGNSIKKGDSIPLNEYQVKQIMKYGNISKHPTWFFKKEVFEVLGGYRDFKNCEDLDFISRAILMNYKVIRMSEVVLEYRVRMNSVSRLNSLDQFKRANKVAKYYAHNQLLTKTTIPIKLTEKESKRFSYYNSILNQAVVDRNFFNIAKSAVLDKNVFIKVMRLVRLKFALKYYLKKVEG